MSEYTGRANLVAVISDGTAVLGLGNIGPYAAKPVMEGKGVLFKNFADVDVFDLCLKTGSTEEFIAAVRTMEPRSAASILRTSRLLNVSSSRRR